jgi:polar amino acid transport system substrate-binding protein
MNTRNLISCALAVLVGATFGASVARGQALPERIAKTKTIINAVNAIYPPMEFKDPQTGELVGFDVDLGNALAKELGVRMQWEESSIDQVFSSLATGRVDMVLSGINDSPERQETMDFIDYLNSSSHFYTLANRNDLNTGTDFCGKTIGTSRATAFPAKVKAWSDANCVAAGKPPVGIEGTSDNAAARSELKQGRFEGGVQGTETLPYIMSQEPGTYKLVGQPFAILYEGIAFRKSDTQLRDAVLAAFEKLVANGTYASIIDKWHLQANMIKRVAVNGKNVE